MQLTAAILQASGVSIVGGGDGEPCGADSGAVGRDVDCSSSSSSESTVESDLERWWVGFLEMKSRKEGRALRVCRRPSIHYLDAIV